MNREQRDHIATIEERIRAIRKTLNPHKSLHDQGAWNTLAAIEEVIDQRRHRHVVTTDGGGPVTEKPTRMNLGPDPLDPHGDGTIRKGDPLYDLLMNGEAVHAQRVGNSDDWDVTTRNAKPRRKTSRWGNLHLHRKHVDGCYRCELNTDEETTQ